MPGYNPYLVAARLKELEDEAASQRMALSQPYCEVIMKHSSYKKPQKDRWGRQQQQQHTEAEASHRSSSSAQQQLQRVPRGAK